MRKTSDRWRDLHPGDMVREPKVTLHTMTKAAKELEHEGYGFLIQQDEEGFLVTCVTSPKPLIGDRPCN